MKNKLAIILSILLISISSAKAFYDMGIYQQNYRVTSDSAILILEAGTEYKLKFKGLSPDIDETTLAQKDLPQGVVEIKHDEHKTMGTSTIHVVEVEKNAPASTGFIHLVTYNGDGGDRVKHKDHYIRTIVVSGMKDSRRDYVCGQVSFDNGDVYNVDFKNKAQLQGAGAKFISDGRCS
jgi:hypothetical protein